MTVQFSHSRTVDNVESYRMGEVVNVSVRTQRFTIREVKVTIGGPGLAGKPIVTSAVLGVVFGKADWVESHDITAPIADEVDVKALRREIVKDALKRNGLRVKDVVII